MPEVSINLNGKVALITGGTRGIGKSIAELFITAGAIILVTGTKKEEIEATINKIRAEYDKYIVTFHKPLLLKNDLIIIPGGSANQ